jgi:predicted transposase YbfD/YdcC
LAKLLDLLAIEAAIVTIDAIETQKAIARKIVDKDADYCSRAEGEPGLPLPRCRRFLG